MTSITYTLVIAALSQFAIAIMLLAKHWRVSKEVRILIMLLVCACGYTLKRTHTPDMEFTWIWWTTLVTANCSIGVLWLFCLSVLGETKAFRPLHYCIAIIPMLLPVSGEIIYAISGYNIRHEDDWSWLFQYTSSGVELLLLGHAILLTYKFWQSDLVELRRYWRLGIVGFTMAYIGFIVIIIQLVGAEAEWIKILQFSWLLMLSLLFNIVTFCVADLSAFTAVEQQPGGLQIAKSETSQQADALFNSKQVELVLNAMTVDKIYRRESLTIAEMAKELVIQEYKIRKIINRHLGYRNFNDFLNFYRLEEAKAMLSSEEYIGIPVLTIAMQCGFKSISSFNKSFKDLENITPTAYRKAQLTSDT